MSRFPDFMHMDLSKVTCGGCLLILFSLFLAFGTAVGGAVLLMGLFPGLFPDNRPERWLIGLLLIVGFAVGAGCFQLGRLAMTRLGLRFYREGRQPPDEVR